MGGAVGWNRPVQLRDAGAVPRGHAPRAQRSLAEEEGLQLAAVLVQGEDQVVLGGSSSWIVSGVL